MTLAKKTMNEDVSPIQKMVIFHCLSISLTGPVHQVQKNPSMAKTLDEFPYYIWNQGTTVVSCYIGECHGLDRVISALASQREARKGPPGPDETRITRYWPFVFQGNFSLENKKQWSRQDSLPPKSGPPKRVNNQTLNPPFFPLPAHRCMEDLNQSIIYPKWFCSKW